MITAIPAIGDSSVLLKWFLSEDEDEVEEAALLLQAHHRGDVQVLILDLTPYEIGNQLIRRRGWTAPDAADQLDALVRLCGTPLSPPDEWRRDAAALAVQHGLTYYDASYAAAARGLGVALVSADRQLLNAGLAETITEFVNRLRLRPG